MSEKHQDAETEEDLVEDSIIPEEDFREAIAACRQDPELDLYFKMAPRGAKLFIGLVFYSTHFGDKVDPRQYAECQAEIEPALTITDLTYLIRFERDKETKKYLRALLAQRKAEAVEVETVPPEQPAPLEQPAQLESPAPSEPVVTLIAPPTRRVYQKGPPPEFWADVRAKTKRSVFLPALKGASILVLLLGGLFALYFAYKAVWGRAEQEPSVADVNMSGDRRVEPTNKVVRADIQQIGKGVPEEEHVVEPAMPHVDDKATSPQVATFPEAPPAPPSADTAAADVPSRPRERVSRIILTDGKKIVRRSGGVIEVPRVFSCAGAGVKPFWVYGAHPEAEAAKEMKAREEWQALVRQAEKGSL